MKKLICILTLLALYSLGAKAEVPVSVLSFKNKVGNVACDQDWYWWSSNLGSAFQDMLLTELANNPKIALLERENIRDINDMEVNLINSEESSHQIQKNQFTKAKYTIIGSVSSYEYCADKKKLSVGVSAVASFLGVGGDVGKAADLISDVGVSKANAKVVIDLRVVETKTGRIIKSVKSEGFAERSNFKINSSLADYSDASETPVGEAAREAISKAAPQLNKVLN